MVFALAGDSTTTSDFAIRTFFMTLSPSDRSAGEPSAAHCRDVTLQFELHQPGQQLRRRRAGRRTSSSSRYASPASIRASNGSLSQQFGGLNRRTGPPASPALQEYRPLSRRPLPHPLKGVGAAVTAGQDAARDRHHVATLLDGASGGDERSALLRGFDDHNREGDPADNAIPEREVLRQRRRPWAELADHNSILCNRLRRELSCSGG